MRGIFRKAASPLYLALLLGALCFLAVSAAQSRASYGTEAARGVPEMTCETEAASFVLALPGRLQDLAPRTAVTLTADIQAKPGESLLVKSAFSPLRVYLDDVLVYEYGQAGTYPAYMNDPPTQLAILPLPAAGGTVSLRLEYSSPVQRGELSVPALYVGTEQALMAWQFRQDSFTFLFSLLLIFLGLVMAAVSLSFVAKISSGTSFLWLGLFSVSAGLWSFGECDLSALLLPYPSLLYDMAYLGLFLMTMPFLRFGLTVLQPRNRLPMTVMLRVHEASVAGVLILQLSGSVDFMKSLYWFHVIAPLGFVTFAACLLWEHFRYRNPAAGRFGPGILILSCAVVLELLNYWLHFTGALTLFFQTGVLGFVVSLGIVSGYYMRDSLLTAVKKERLELAMTAMERQLDLQRWQYQRLAENDETVKAQRHDLRHQLAVLRSLTADEQRLNAYIDGLTAKIPSLEGVRLCENYAVNAVAAHYCAMAEQAGIDIDVRLIAPRELNADIESDLCVVVGNLMENAVEACNRMDGGVRFIRIGSGLQDGVLTVAVDNSFSGTVQKRNGVFLSAKRPGVGTGISSVTAVAKRHGGSARFEARDGVFQASVYVRIMS